MPRGPIHRFYNSTVTQGRSDGHHIDRTMDATTRIHPGKRHRKDVVHTGPYVIGQFGEGDPDAGIIYLMHTALDEKYTCRDMSPLERLYGVKKFKSKKPFKTAPYGRRSWQKGTLKAS